MDDLVGLGASDTIHGYNPGLQDTGGGTRFDAFEMHAHHPGRPERFHFELVQGTAYLDHQGHIVPQNAYAARLNAIAIALDAFLLTSTYDLAGVRLFFNANYVNLNCNFVTDYVENVLIAHGHAPPNIFVDPAGADLEEKLGGFFSVINWNPVNICRAPSDGHRGNYPGNNPDILVAQRLLLTPNAATITLPAPFAAFLTANLANLAGAGNVDAFITACNDCLPAMTVAPYPPAGFYQFLWAIGAFPQ